MEQHSMFFRNITFIIVLICVCAPLFSYAQGSSALPVATMQLVPNAQPAGGEVVVYDQDTNSYSIASIKNDERAYGVTAARPALVFVSTATGTVPVVSVGTTAVAVTLSNGPIARGDLLTASDIAGTAMRATLSDKGVFAVALEPFGEATSSATGTIMANIGVDQAHALQLARKNLGDLTSAASTSASSTLKQQTIVSYARAGIAAAIALCGLMFILYSFRSTIAKSALSIGRNPRARTSIMTLAVGNIIFALILCAVVIFVAVAVLILPV